MGILKSGNLCIINIPRAVICLSGLFTGLVPSVLQRTTSMISELTDGLGESLLMLAIDWSRGWVCPYRFLYADILDTLASKTLSGKPTSRR